MILFIIIQYNQSCSDKHCDMKEIQQSCSVIKRGENIGSRRIRKLYKTGISYFISLAF